MFLKCSPLFINFKGFTHFSSLHGSPIFFDFHHFPFTFPSLFHHCFINLLSFSWFSKVLATSSFPFHLFSSLPAVFPKQVYLYGVLTPLKRVACLGRLILGLAVSGLAFSGLAFSLPCAPGSHLSPILGPLGRITCLPLRVLLVA
jgi:hypothetical protein